MYEIADSALPSADAPENLAPDFGLTAEDLDAAGLLTGGHFAGGAIIWAHVSEGEQFLLFVTSHRERPDWLRSPALDTERFEMHIVLVRNANGIPVVTVSSTTRKREAELLARLTSTEDGFRLARPELMRSFLSVASISNVQHLGTRNTAGGSQARTYTTNSGSAVEDDLANDDLRGDVIGHVGALCHIDGSDYNGGVSIGNSRIWIIKQFPIDEYIDFLSGLLAAMGAGQPGEIRRLGGRFEDALTQWPTSCDPVAVALDEYFLIHVNTVDGVQPTDLDPMAHGPTPEGHLPLSIDRISWTCELRTNGTLAAENRTVVANTTHGDQTLEELLVAHPPTIYYRDGRTARGTKLAPAPSPLARLQLDELLTTWDWTGTTITSETPAPGVAKSIHERVIEHLTATYPEAWLIGDDGSGEIADHIALVTNGEQLTIHLVHSKGSSRPQPGVRTGDFDELVGQIIRSKRWVALAGSDFFQRLAHRLRNRPSTILVAGPGSLNDLIAACGIWSDQPPIVNAHYVGVQPGLDVARLKAQVESSDQTSVRLAETLGACASWVAKAPSRLTIVGSSSDATRT